MLAFNRSDAMTFAGSISGTGAVRQIGSGALTLTGASTLAAAPRSRTALFGIARREHGAATGGLTFAGGTLSTTASFDTARTVSLTQQDASMSRPAPNSD